ncbi:hypothetical protein HYV87_00120 [Candidatus Woesearchaeota archaeon]|nr:hypothetical protein [Candidatus Woesearchaeota archaeon]
MKKILIAILLISLSLVLSCAPTVSDQELQAGLENLSDQDLDTIIDEADKNENPLAGQASSMLLLPSIKNRVSNSQLLTNAQALKIKRLEKKIADMTAGQGVPPILVPPGIKEVEGTTPDDDKTLVPAVNEE